MTVVSSDRTHTDDFLLLSGFGLCVAGFYQGYWYWTFVGVLLFLSGLGVFKPQNQGVL